MSSFTVFEIQSVCGGLPKLHHIKDKEPKMVPNMAQNKGINLLKYQDILLQS